MMNFCTLFDSFYLSRGLALYESIKEHTEDFHLYIFAFDDITYEILNKTKSRPSQQLFLSKNLRIRIFLMLNKHEPGLNIAGPAPPQ